MGIIKEIKETLHTWLIIMPIVTILLATAFIIHILQQLFKKKKKSRMYNENIQHERWT